MKGITMKEVNLIESKDLREQVVSRVEVLDKVKKLFLIPEMDVMTTKMIADYYEVGESAVQKCYQRNKVEIDSDGVIRKTVLEMKNFWSGHNVRVKNVIGGAEVVYENIVIRLPNSGIKLFSKRAVLRVGMLLRDSPIACEVRTQLLNVFEHTTDAQRTAEINEETRLQINIGKAYTSQNMMDMLQATMEYQAYKDRYTTQLKIENGELSKINKELETTNALLTRKSMEWGHKPILNALMRKYAIVCFSKSPYQFASAWNALYRQVKYKLGWDIARRTTGKNMIDRIKETEFMDVITVAAGLCEANGISVGKVINDTNFELITERE